MSMLISRSRAVLLIVASLAMVLSLTGMSPAGDDAVPRLDWRDCGGGFQCATAKVPRDYDRPHGGKLELAVIRWPAKDQANRIGTLFVNPGGPGGSGIEFFRTAPPGALDIFSRFDLVSWDPRGIGESRPAIDCSTDAEDDASIANRFTRPDSANRAALVRRAKEAVQRCVDRNPGILPYLSTANTAHDLDLLRAAVGDRKLTYIGISHGTHIGATYAALFPGRSRALVMDAPIDADVWDNRPTESLREHTAGFEDSLDRFFTACAANQTACGFGGTNPEDAFDDLVARLNRAPAPAPDAAHHDPVSGDDILYAAFSALYSPQLWPPLAAALAQAETGNASQLRDLADQFAGRRPDGTWTPTGVFFTTTAQDWRLDRRVDHYLAEGRHAYSLFPHFWWNTNGYERLAYAVYPVPQRDFYRGPFTNPPSAAPVLVIATTHDPVTPYVWGQRYTAQLGNARLLTYRGEGHGSLTDINPCILQTTISYLNDGVLPAEGATCTQEFEPFPSAESRAVRTAWLPTVSLTR